MSDIRFLRRRGLDGEDHAAYEHILTRFATDPANRDDLVAFLKTLSQEGLDLLKKAQSLPSDAVIDLESEHAGREQALNLILPDSRQVDLDNNGFAEGITGGNMWRFPPINAPQSVKDAWEEASQGLSDGDRLRSMGLFLVDMASANIRRDDAGTPIGLYGPEDPEFRNPFADPEFGYAANAEWHLSKLENERHLMSGQQYKWSKAMLTRWADALGGVGMA